ncbi:hypothetical protein AB0M54_40425 [Actinoplanes sp. NPDC051470]|uniref:hypothetical protein n=1 Tax=unclassified Actinoplanes TaxID=2626549 RepID=UPI003429E568
MKKFNAANLGCKVSMQEFDTQGNADQATPIDNWRRALQTRAKISHYRRRGDPPPKDL